MSKKQKLINSKKNDRGVKVPFVYIREAIDGETSVYGLNIFDKMKKLVTQLELQSGRAAKKAALIARREQDILSSLQVTSSTFMQEKVYEKLKLNDNPTGDRVIEVQLDPKFNVVMQRLIDEDPTMDISVRPINQNYLKYSDNIPIRARVSKKQNLDI